MFLLSEMEVAMYQQNLFRFGGIVGISIFALAPFLGMSARAFPGGGFHGAGGGGFAGGGPSRGIGGGIPGGFSRSYGGGSPMIRTAPIGAGMGVHSLSGIGPSHSYIGSHINSMPHSSALVIRHPGALSIEGHPGASGLVGHTGRVAAGTLTESQNWTARSLHGVGQTSALRNGALASLAARDPTTRALSSTTFHGRFAGQNWQFANGGWFWHHRHPFVALGWFGPLFWPYAYDDFIDYTFWPYAYDVFWPYAYDDLYVGIFGPYSYEGPVSVSRIRSRHFGSRSAAGTAAEVCREKVPALISWPIQQIAQTVQPDQTQQAALDSLREVGSKALDLLQSACPEELASTPTGRLAAMRKRIEVMLQAVAVVKPALDGFYILLTDEQKSRFNAITPQPPSARRHVPDLSQLCSEQAIRPTKAPIERIEQVVHPTDAQRVSLQALNDASTRAADYLKANCSFDETLTPPGRIAAMEQRLNAMLEAIKIVQPELESFYGGLTDEQKARFNQLGSPQT
jgi:hypothetical protein